MNPGTAFFLVVMVAMAAWQLFGGRLEPLVERWLAFPDAGEWGPLIGPTILVVALGAFAVWFVRERTSRRKGTAQALLDRGFTPLSSGAALPDPGFAEVPLFAYAATIPFNRFSNAMRGMIGRHPV